VTIVGQINAGGCPLIADLSRTPGEDWNDVLKASDAIIRRIARVMDPTAK
jgi:hypothetical protein